MAATPVSHGGDGSGRKAAAALSDGSRLGQWATRQMTRGDGGGAGGGAGLEGGGGVGCDVRFPTVVTRKVGASNMERKSANVGNVLARGDSHKTFFS